MIIPNIWKNQSHVPNHQSVVIFVFTHCHALSPCSHSQTESPAFGEVRLCPGRFIMVHPVRTCELDGIRRNTAYEISKPMVVQLGNSTFMTIRSSLFHTFGGDPLLLIMVDQFSVDMRIYQAEVGSYSVQQIDELTLNQNSRNSVVNLPVNNTWNSLIHCLLFIQDPSLSAYHRFSRCDFAKTFGEGRNSGNPLGGH